METEFIIEQFEKYMLNLKHNNNNNIHIKAHVAVVTLVYCLFLNIMYVNVLAWSTDRLCVHCLCSHHVTDDKQASHPELSTLVKHFSIKT